MPVAMEKALERVADQKGLTGKRRAAFVYGSMRNAGWKPEREVKEFGDIIDMPGKGEAVMRKLRNKIMAHGADYFVPKDDVEHAVKKAVAGGIGAGFALGGGAGIAGALVGRKIVKKEREKMLNKQKDLQDQVDNLKRKRELTMNTPTRLERLVTLNARTNGLIKFNHDPRYPYSDETDEQNSSAANSLLGGITAGVGGTLAHQSIQRGGGYGATGLKVASGVAAGKTAFNRAGQAGESFIQKVTRALKSGVRGAHYAMQSRRDKVVELSAKLDEILFISPLGEFEKAQDALVKRKKDEYEAVRQEQKPIIKKAKGVIRESRHGILAAQRGSDPAFKSLHEKLGRESYIGRGLGIGFLGGAAAGASAGIKGFPRGAKTVGGVIGGYVGGVAGAVGGLQIGGRIRRKHPLPETA